MKPRVAVVLSGFGLVHRGAETMLEQLLPRLQNRFELEVYSMSGKGPGGRSKRAVPRSEVESIYLATKTGRKVLDTLFLDPIHIEWTTHLLSSLPDLRRRNYDVIWHETGRWGGKILAQLRRQQGVRLLDVAHSSHPGWEVPFAECKPDIYVTADRQLAELVRAKVPDLRIEIVQPGIDTELFAPGVEPLVFDLPRPIALIAGALSPEKSPALALAAAAEIGASVVVAGSGPLSSEVDDLAAEKLGKERYLRTQLERAEMPALFAAADVVVLASPLESGALAVLEAMACGIPVVTAADSIRNEIVGDGGVLVEGRQMDDYAQGIARALEGAWGDRPRKRALEYSIDRAADRYEEILSELAAGPR